MCEPTTLALALGGASAYGTTLAVGTGAAGLMTAASVGLTVAGTTMQVASERQARKLQEAKFEMQERRYSAEIQEERIAALDQANNRKRDYMKKMSSFYANTAGRGITQASPSASALLTSNEDILRQDLNALSLSSFERQMFSKSMKDEATIAKQASSPIGEIASVIGGARKTVSLFDEITPKQDKLNFNSVSSPDPFSGRVPGGFKKS